MHTCSQQSNIVKNFLPALVIQINRHLEVVTKWPVAQHLKEGVVREVLPHLLKVIVFAAHTNTLLAVDNPFQGRHLWPWVNGAKEQWLELKTITQNCLGLQLLFHFVVVACFIIMILFFVFVHSKSFLFLIQNNLKTHKRIERAL